MAAFSYRKIDGDLEYYAKAYRTFISKFVAGRVSSANWHASFLESDNVKEVLASLDIREPLRILGVGSGTGGFDNQLICQLLKKHPVIQTTVVEPARDHIQHFQSLASKGDLSEVTWDWRQETWQEYWKYRKSSSEAPKFHFILAIHVLYYVDDLEQSILHMMSCLKDGGLLVIMLVTGDGSYVRVSRFISNNPHIEINSTEVAKLLEKHQIEFSETGVSAEAEVTECFEKDDETTKHLIDFISHVLHFRETAPPDVVTSFMEALRDISIKRGGGLFLDCGSSALIATKRLGL